MSYKIGDIVELNDGTLAYITGVHGVGDEKYSAYDVDQPSKTYTFGEASIKSLVE